MKPKKVYYSFTPGELGYLLFGSKRCPMCKNKLKKVKQFNLKKEEDISAAHISYSNLSSDVPAKEYYFEFVCVGCGKVYSLKNLSVKEKKK